VWEFLPASFSYVASSPHTSVPLCRDNWAPIRDEDNEIAATIAVLKLAKKSLGKPTYLVMGNDLGVLTAKIIQKLGEDGEIDVIDGFIYVNRETGEFRRYNRDGSIWESADNTPPTD
jgi:hypothetical protein